MQYETQDALHVLTEAIQRGDNSTVQAITQFINRRRYSSIEEWINAAEDKQ